MVYVLWIFEFSISEAFTFELSLLSTFSLCCKGWVGSLDSFLMSKWSKSDSLLVLLVKPAANNRPTLEHPANVYVIFKQFFK